MTGTRGVVVGRQAGRLGAREDVGLRMRGRVGRQWQQGQLA